MKMKKWILLDVSVHIYNYVIKVPEFQPLRHGVNAWRIIFILLCVLHNILLHVFKFDWKYIDDVTITDKTYRVIR